MKRAPTQRCLLCAALALIAGGCSPQRATPAASEVSEEPIRLTAVHLPNPVQVHTRVISGGLPEGDAAFAELRAMGVRTIISVDGAKPELEAAARHGLRYVHLPHGYDGIPTQRIRELAVAVKRLEGRIYIHCHHGKHRSPAAASVACVAAGLLPASKAMSVLELAGTSRHYRGLYQAVGRASPLDQALLDALAVEFGVSADVPPMAEAMAALERTHDHLTQIAAGGWRSPAERPGLDPAHEALLLREHFTELLRLDEVRRRPAGFEELLRDSQQAAAELESRLRESPPGADPTGSFSRAAVRIALNCQRCHQQYRDVPLVKR